MWVCDLCNRVFKTKRGVGVHRRAAHAVEFHAARVEERLTNAVKVRWVDEEVEALARAEAVLLRGGARYINASLAQEFPERSLEAIKGMRRSGRYKESLERAKARLGERGVGGAVGGDVPGEARVAQPAVPAQEGVLAGEAAVGREPEAEVRGQIGLLPARRETRRPANERRALDRGSMSNSEGDHEPELRPQPDPVEPAEMNWRVRISNWARSIEIGDDETLAAVQARGLKEALLSADTDRIHMEVTACLASMYRALPARRHLDRRPRRPEGRRALRKRQYARIQNMYKRNRGRAAEECLSGKWRSEAGEGMPNREDMLGFWRGIMEAPAVHDDREAIPVGPELKMLLDPVSLAETTALIKSLKDTCEGPDGVKNVHIRGTNPLLVAMILNAVLYTGRPPDNFLVSRTVLLPKVEAPRDPGEFRPISIANAYARLFHKLLYSRPSPVAPMRETQKAFRRVDGTAANLVILDTLLRDARTRLKPLHLAFIDLRKAFDGVGHDTIVRAAIRLGVPAPLVGYLREHYQRSSTRLLDSDVVVTNGVRQGDPLSPLHFNAVLDEAIRAAETRMVGYMMNDHHFQVMAFADDMVLVASTARGLQTQTDVVLGVLGAGGLLPNPGKCATLAILSDGKNKRWLCDPTPRLTIGAALVPALTVQGTYKYLGVQMAATGKVELPRAFLARLLSELTAAPLKPQQRMYMLRVHVVPKALHQLVLGRTSSGQLDGLDKAVRKAMRSWLRLPKDTVTAYFHGDTADGGLGIPSFRTTVPRLRESRMSKLARSTETDIRAAVTSQTYIATSRRIPGIVYRGRRISSKAISRATWKEQLLDTRDGAGLANIGETAHVNSWLIDGSSMMRGAAYIKVIKVRGNVWMTRARASRGRGDGAPLCDAGCHARETLSHMMQSCSRTHDTRVRRHDNVNLFLKDRFEASGCQVILGPSIPTQGGVRKPDLVIAKNGKAAGLDTTIVADAGVANMSDAFDRKVAYYQIGDISRWVCEATQAGEVLTGAVVLSWRGALCAKSANILLDWGLTKRDLKMVVVKTLEGGIASAEVFSKIIVRERPARRRGRQVRMEQ